MIKNLLFPFYLVLLAFSFSSLRAQQPPPAGGDTLAPTIHHWRQVAVPSLLAIYGLTAPFVGFAHQIDLRTSQHMAPNAAGRGNWDSYLRWAPAVGILTLKAAGVQTRHSFKQQAILQASAYFLTAGAVFTGKQIFKRERPDGSDNQSFPSGHSALAFTGAAIWRLELKQTHPVLSWGGYLLAGITAAQRVRHNEHWVSDVVGGAGVGILSAQASYWLLERYRASRVKKELPSYF